MKTLSIHTYFNRIAFRTTIVLSAGILIYLGVSLYLQYSEKKSQLNLQAMYVANAIRNDFINGNQIPLYEQCRSLAAQENIKKILIKKENYVFCNEGNSDTSAFIISVSVPVKFQPEIEDSESTPDNIAGTVTLGIDGSEMVYYILASLLGLLIFSSGIFIFIKRSYLAMEKDVILPITELTAAMRAGSYDYFKTSSKPTRIDELQTMISSYIKFLETAKTAEELRIEKTKYDAIISVAKQVAHDIRSPLSVLNMLIPTLSVDASSEKCELLVQATQRIDMIAEDLLAKGKKNISTNLLTSDDIEKLVLEKQMILSSQSRKTRIEFTIPPAMQFKSKVTKLDFERITSNLLNNALDSISNDETGLVELKIAEVDSSTILIIKDNGKGIPQDLLSKIGTKGFSSGKTNGNGLGVYHAKSTIEQAGGIFNITSQLGIGTTVTITA